MIFKRPRQTRSEPGGYFHLENELNHRKAQGFGHGSHIRLEDSAGNTWQGMAERGDGDAIYYRFRNSEGRTVSGMGQGSHLVLRDDEGRIWKGFVA